MAAMKFTLNGKAQTVDAVPLMPLLWVLRDTLGMTGTKFGCGMALCGACTVHVTGQPVRSCVTAISSVAGKSVTTIDGLFADRVEQGNFDRYDVLRIDEMPKVEVHIVATENAPGGIGEASTPGIAPAVCNAIFAATGKRIRRLPIRAADLA